MGEQPPAVSKGTVGCVLVPVAFLAVMFTLGTLAFAAFLIVSGPSRPGSASPVVMLMPIAILGALAAFFAMITKRLVAALRGQEVPYLMPPWVGVIVGVVFGLFSLAGVVFALTGAIHSTGRDTGRAIAATILFLSFAVISVRSLLRHRALGKGKAEREKPAP